LGLSAGTKRRGGPFLDREGWVIREMGGGTGRHSGTVYELSVKDLLSRWCRRGPNSLDRRRGVVGSRGLEVWGVGNWGGWGGESLGGGLCYTIRFRLHCFFLGVLELYLGGGVSWRFFCVGSASFCGFFLNGVGFVWIFLSLSPACFLEFGGNTLFLLAGVGAVCGFMGVSGGFVFGATLLVALGRGLFFVGGWVFGFDQWVLCVCFVGGQCLFSGCFCRIRTRLKNSIFFAGE